MCSGILGLDRGLERAIGPIRVQCYLEIEAIAIENLVCAMEKSVLAPTLIFSDIKTFPAQIFRGAIDGILCSWPCQPFSLAGKLGGESDPRHLWPYIKEHIRTIEPVFLFAENVGNHLNIGYEAVRRDLQEMGYHVEEGIYAAQEVGAPHRRERLFILAVKHGYDISGVVCNANSAGLQRQFNLQESNVPTQSGVGLADTNYVNWREQQQFCSSEGARTRNESGRESSPSGVGHIADSYNDRRPWKRGDIQNESETSEGTQQWQEREETLWERSRTEPEPISTDVADSISEGLQGHGGHEHGEVRTGVGENRPTPACSLSSQQDRWPARPGEEQYDWEEPRTLTKEAESEVGLTVDGYGFREDLLRLAGNAVCPPQAEYAFRDLIRKHREHNERN